MQYDINRYFFGALLLDLPGLRPLYNKNKIGFIGPVGTMLPPSLIFLYNVVKKIRSRDRQYFTDKGN
jgi:hypothetical protein